MDEAVKTDEVVSTGVVKRGRGRPKGSKNKPKLATPVVVETVSESDAAPAVDNGF